MKRDMKGGMKGDMSPFTLWFRHCKEMKTTNKLNNSSELFPRSIYLFKSSKTNSGMKKIIKAHNYVWTEVCLLHV
jgi:hypothetical protein